MTPVWFGSETKKTVPLFLSETKKTVPPFLSVSPPFHAVVLLFVITSHAIPAIAIIDVPLREICEATVDRMFMYGCERTAMRIIISEAIARIVSAIGTAGGRLFRRRTTRAMITSA